MKFPRHDIDTAPPRSRETLFRILESQGSIPEAFAVFAESPAAIRCYCEMSAILRDEGALSPREQQIAMLAVSVAAGSNYCVAAHSRAAGKAGIPSEDIDALRGGSSPVQPRDAAVARFARAVWESHGQPAQEDREIFAAAGFGASEALEIVALVALKVFGALANRLADTPLDACLEPHRWSPPGE